MFREMTSTIVYMHDIYIYVKTVEQIILGVIAHKLQILSFFSFIFTYYHENL